MRTGTMEGLLLRQRSTSWPAENVPNIVKRFHGFRRMRITGGPYQIRTHHIVPNLLPIWPVI